MSLVLSDFIGTDASSGGATLVQGKEKEIQQECRPIPYEFPHQELGNTVLAENNFPPAVQHPFHGIAIREALLRIKFTTVM